MPKPKEIASDERNTPAFPKRSLRTARPIVEETTEAKELSEAAADVVRSIETSPTPATEVPVRRGGRQKGDDTKDFNTPLTKEERELLEIVKNHQKPLSNRYVARKTLVEGLKTYAAEHDLHDPTE